MRVKNKVNVLVLAGVVGFTTLFSLQIRVGAVVANEPIIENNCTILSDDQAREIYHVVEKSILVKYGEDYEFENFIAEFADVEINDTTYTVDLDISVDMTLVENPMESEYVQGMQAAVASRGIAEQNSAQQIYEKTIENMMTNYNNTQLTAILYRLCIDLDEIDVLDLSEVEIYYRNDITSTETIVVPVDFGVQESSRLNALDGQEYINNSLVQTYSITTNEPTYDRNAAVAYALAHATDEPELTGEDKSDCANFVSKCINAGGIPVDVPGKWYPSATWGGWPGENWMRTGFYENGGVIPYMNEKDYFSYVSTAHPTIGSILEWTNKSHVAIITYADQNGTYKYTDHSDTKKQEDEIQTLYTSEMASYIKIHVSNLLWE